MHNIFDRVLDVKRFESLLVYSTALLPKVKPTPDRSQIMSHHSDLLFKFGHFKAYHLATNWNYFACHFRKSQADRALENIALHIQTTIGEADFHTSRSQNYED